MTSHSTLEDYYVTTFALVQHHRWSLSDVEDMVPFECQIYVDMLLAHLKELENRRGKADG